MFATDGNYNVEPRFRVSLFPAKATWGPYVQPGTQPIAVAEFVGGIPLDARNFSLTNASAWVGPMQPFVVGTHMAPRWALSVQWVANSSNSLFCWYPCVDDTLVPISGQGITFSRLIQATGDAPATWSNTSSYTSLYFKLYASDISIAPTPTPTMTPTATQTATVSVTPTISITPSPLPFGTTITMLDNTDMRRATLRTNPFGDYATHGYSLAFTNTEGSFTIQSITVAFIAMTGNATRDANFTFCLYTSASSGWVLNPYSQLVASANVTIRLPPRIIDPMTQSHYTTIDMTPFNFTMDPRRTAYWAITWKSSSGDTDWGYKGYSNDYFPTASRGFSLLKWLYLTSGNQYKDATFYFAAIWIQGSRTAYPSATATATALPTVTTTKTPNPALIPSTAAATTPTATKTPTATASSGASATPTTSPIVNVGLLTFRLLISNLNYLTSVINVRQNELASSLRNDTANFLVSTMTWPRPAPGAISAMLGQDLSAPSLNTIARLSVQIPSNVLDRLYLTTQVMLATFSSPQYVEQVFTATIALLRQALPNAAISVSCIVLPETSGTYAASPMPQASPSPLPPTTAIVIPVVFTGMAYSSVASGTTGSAYLQGAVRADIFNVFSALGLIIDDGIISMEVTAAPGGVMIRATVPFAEPLPGTASLLATAIQTTVEVDSNTLFYTTLSLYSSQIVPGGTISSITSGVVVVDPNAANTAPEAGGVPTSPSGSNLGPIVGGAVGGLALLGIIVAVVVFVIMPQQAKRAELAQKKPTKDGGLASFEGGVDIQMVSPMHAHKGMQV